MSAAESRCPFNGATAKSKQMRAMWLRHYDEVIAQFPDADSELITWQEFVDEVGGCNYRYPAGLAEVIGVEPPEPAAWVVRVALYRRTDLDEWTASWRAERDARALSAASRREAAAVRRRIRIDRMEPGRSACGFKGVQEQTICKGAWRAIFNGAHIGSFTSPIDAALAVDRVRMENGYPPINLPHRWQEALDLDMPTVRPRSMQDHLLDALDRMGPSTAREIFNAWEAPCRYKSVESLTQGLHFAMRQGRVAKTGARWARVSERPEDAVNGAEPLPTEP